MNTLDEGSQMDLKKLVFITLPIVCMVFLWTAATAQAAPPAPRDQLVNIYGFDVLIKKGTTAICLPEGDSCTHRDPVSLVNNQCKRIGKIVVCMPASRT